MHPFVVRISAFENRKNRRERGKKIESFFKVDQCIYLLTVCRAVELTTSSSQVLHNIEHLRLYMSALYRSSLVFGEMFIHCS